MAVFTVFVCTFVAVFTVFEGTFVAVFTVFEGTFVAVFTVFVCTFVAVFGVCSVEIVDGAHRMQLDLSEIPFTDPVELRGGLGRRP